jgi:hypothetical protein
VTVKPIQPILAAPMAPVPETPVDAGNALALIRDQVYTAVKDLGASVSLAQEQTDLMLGQNAEALFKLPPMPAH